MGTNKLISKKDSEMMFWRILSARFKKGEMFHFSLFRQSSKLIECLLSYQFIFLRWFNTKSPALSCKLTKSYCSVYSRLKCKTRGTLSLCRCGLILFSIKWYLIEHCNTLSEFLAPISFAFHLYILFLLATISTAWYW